MVKIMVMLSIVFSYGLQFCVPSEIAWTHVEPWLRKRNWITRQFANNKKSSTLNLNTIAGSTMTQTTDISSANTDGNKEKLADKTEEEAPILWAYYIMRSVMILITCTGPF